MKRVSLSLFFILCIFFSSCSGEETQKSPENFKEESEDSKSETEKPDQTDKELAPEDKTSQEESKPEPEFDGPVEFDLEARIPARNLSEFKLLKWSSDKGFIYNERVIAYDLNTALFSDFAYKARAIYVPEGTQIEYSENDVFKFPVGTIIVKSFYYPADFSKPKENIELIETRVLVHYESGWKNWPYIWNDEQSDAVLSPAGMVKQVSFTDEQGLSKTANYLVPQLNQCASCHLLQESPGSKNTYMTPIGPKARNMNRIFDYGEKVGKKNQIEYLAEKGMLKGHPDIFPKAYDFSKIESEGLEKITGAELIDAARTYLDINCAHCHNPTGVQGQTSQLFLNYDNEDRFRLGVLKKPGSAGEGTGGFTYDIVPGNPDESILIYRMVTEEIGAIMPLFGRSLKHELGVELIRKWILEMPAEETEEISE